MMELTRWWWCVGLKRVCEAGMSLTGEDEVGQGAGFRNGCSWWPVNLTEGCRSQLMLGSAQARADSAISHNSLQNEYHFWVCIFTHYMVNWAAILASCHADVQLEIASAFYLLCPSASLLRWWVWPAAPMPECNLSSACLSSERPPGFLSWGLPVVSAYASWSERWRSPAHRSFLNTIAGHKCV